MQKRFKFIIILLLISILLVSFFNILALHEEIRDNKYNKLLSDFTKITTSFSIWLDNKQEMLETTKDLVNNFNRDEVLKYKTSNPYLNINNEDRDVSQVYVGLKDGSFITGGLWVPPSYYDSRTRIWYQKALALDDTIFTPVYIDKETGDKMVTVSSPLYMADIFVGVISADIFLNHISNYLNHLLADEKLFVYLIDKKGTVMADTSQSDLLGQNVFLDKESSGIIGYLNKAKDTSNTVRMQYDYYDNRIEGIVQNVAKGNWFLVVASVDDQSSFVKFAIGKNNLIVNFFVLLIIVGLLYIIIKQKKEMEVTNQLLMIDNERDFLTGAYNRRHFNTHANEYLKTKSNTFKGGLLMIDVDNFKEYNDTYGHLKGDEALIEVTKTMNNQIRKGDIFARYGGEEFVVLLKDIPSESVLKTAEKLRRSVEALNIKHSQSSFGHMTVSIGAVAVESAKIKDVYQLVNLSDIALYKAKESGRNIVYMEKIKI